MTDDEFLASFSACTLPAEQFSHAGHIRLAWIDVESILFSSIRISAQA